MSFPSAKFHEAASYLSNASSVTKVSTSIKLELYGLFKYVTVSGVPTTSRPSIFDMSGRAKWDAWKSVGESVKSAEEAEERYLEIAQSLGWSEGAHAESTGGVSGGFGTAVSTMAVPTEEDDGSLHYLALSDDATRITELLERTPETDLNEKDEFGYTALHLAADRGNGRIVKLLLDQGANPSIKDSDDLTAAEIAKIAGHNDIAALLS